MRKNLLALGLFLTILTGSGRAFSKDHYTHPDNIKLGLPFSDAVKMGKTILLSGQIGNVFGKLELVPGGIEAESRQAINNIATILQSGFALGLDAIAKCQVILADIKDWQTFNMVYRERFKDPLPVRTASGANGLALNARVEMECVAEAP